MKVHDAMSPEVQLCTPDDTLKDAAEAMAALNVGLLPVTDNERLVGMVSDRDIAIRGVGLGRGPDCRVGDVMSAEVKYCYDDQDLDDVTTNMGDIQVRRLPVLNRDKRLVHYCARRYSAGTGRQWHRGSAQPDIAAGRTAHIAMIVATGNACARGALTSVLRAGS